LKDVLVVFDALKDPAELWEYLVADGTYDDITVVVLARYVDRKFGMELDQSQMEYLMEDLDKMTEG
jgi:hypothetical protein